MHMFLANGLSVPFFNAIELPPWEWNLAFGELSTETTRHNEICPERILSAYLTASTATQPSPSSWWWIGDCEFDAIGEGDTVPPTTLGVACTVALFHSKQIDISNFRLELLDCSNLELRCSTSLWTTPESWIVESIPIPGFRWNWNQLFTISESLYWCFLTVKESWIGNF